MGLVKKMTTRAIIGDKVLNMEGVELGEIKDLLIDEHGQIEYGVLGYGGMLGMGEKNIAVPFEALEMRENEDFFRLNVDKEILEEADSQMEYQDKAYYIY